MKKSIMFATAMIVVAGTLFTKANKETKMSDTVLANVEALAQSEKMEDGYFCFGTGSVVCPYSGKLVGGYLKKRNLE
ncbi:MAG: NVEALA domain-containing protein [Bacteroidaceae bacterium]|nr:NVEALA domain-containing protein [Bacteroidaceae bacterium]